MSFPIGWTIRGEARHIESVTRARRLAETTFARHQHPERAARATLSLRTAYPWMSPTLAAKLGAFGVPVDDPGISEIAGLALGRRVRRGWVDGGRRRNPREVRNVTLSPTPWRSLDRTETAPSTFAQRRGVSTEPEPSTSEPLLLGPTRVEDLGLGGPTNDGLTLMSDRSSTLQAERERLAFAYARAPGAGVFQGARPEAIGLPANTPPEEIARFFDQGGMIGEAARNLPVARMGAQIREHLPSIDATVSHIRRGGLTFRGVPLPGGDSSADELREVYLGAGGDEVVEMLREKREQLESQYPDLRGSQYPTLPNGMTPSMRAVYDGIVTALDFVRDETDAVGPTLAFQTPQSIAGIGLPSLGVDLNASDLWNVPYDAGKGAVRTATMTMDSLWQAGQATFRQAVTDPGSLVDNPFTQQGAQDTLVDAAEINNQMDLGIVLDQLANGQSVDVGEGFFVNPDSEVGQRRLRAERRQGLIGGHVITMGRWAADRIPGVEPDDTAFNIVSGAVDLGWILVEPGGALVDVAARSRAVRRATATAGGFADTRSVHPEYFDEWIRSDRQAQAVLEHYADLDDPVAIARSYETMSRRGGAARMPEWAHYLLADGAAGDTAYVEEMLRNLTGMGYQSPGVALRGQNAIPGLGGMVAPGVAWRRRLARSRLAQETPNTGARALDVYDPDNFVGGLRDSMRNARVDEETIASIVHRAYTEGFQAPTRVRVQQLERELADLPASGPVLRNGTVEDAAVVRQEIADTLAELRPGLFINRVTPRRNVLFGLWEEAQAAKRERLIEAGVGEATAADLTNLSDIGRRLDRGFAEDMQNQGAYWLRLATDDTRDGATNRRLFGYLDGEPITDMSSPGFAHMAAEHLTRYLPLEDDYRQLARLTRNMPERWLGRLTANAEGQLYPMFAVAESFMSKAWKPSRLLRPAYPIRVVGEEQARIAGAGLDSLFSHPLSAFALVMGTRRDGRLHSLLDTLTAGRADDIGRLQTDALGNPWEMVSEFGDVLNSAPGRNRMFATMGTNGRFDPYAYIRHGSDPEQWTPGFSEAWLDLLGRASASEDMRFVAKSLLGEGQYANIDEIIEAGGGVARTADDLRLAGSQNAVTMLRASLMDSHPELGRRGPRTFAARYASDPDAQILNWDDFVESIQVRLFEITGRDPDLLHAVAHSRFPDGLQLNRADAARINPKAVKRLREQYAHLAPEVVPGDESWHAAATGSRRSRAGARAFEGYDQALAQAFSLFGAIPTDRLSRSPAFRQFHVRRMQELLPFMSRGEQQRFLATAADAMKVPERGWHLRLSALIQDDVAMPTMASLRRAAMEGTGDLTLEMADDLAKRAALDNTRWLLYDVHKQGQLGDALRIVFPFFEAWKEVGTRWMQLLAQRPGTVLQRSTQVVGATGSPQDWQDVVDDPSQHGWMFTNSTGETVFTYPAAEWFTGAMTGVPVELTGSLNGLTIMSSVLPGVGPVVQMPLSAIPAFRDSPALEGVRTALFPFGLGVSPADDPGGALSDLLFSPAVQRLFQGIAAGGLEQIEVPGTDFAPVGDVPFGRDLLRAGASVFAGGSAPDNDRLFLNSVFDVMRWNVSTGEYFTGPAEGRDGATNINRLIDESTETAGLLYVIRGLAGLSLPSAPIPEFQVEGSDGSLLMLRALTDRYRQMQDEDYSTAAQRFLDQYGENLSLVLQAKTVPRTAMLPVTREADRWVADNPGVMEDYPLTFGLWAPGNTGEGEFDFEAYNRYVRDRAVQTLGRELTIRDLVGLANDRAGSIEYRRAEEQIRERPGATTESGNLTEDAQRFLSTQVRPQLEDRYPGFGTDGLERGPSTDDIRRAIGRPGQTETEVRRMVDDERIDAPLREAVASYLDAHDAMLERSTEFGSTTYFESVGTRPLRDFLRGTVAPQIRDDLPERYRSRWDVIWERLFDRAMIAPWLESTDEEAA